MNFEPTNRHIQVIPIEEEKKESDLAIVLPSDYKEPMSPYLLCEVVACAKDSKYRLTGENKTKIIIQDEKIENFEHEKVSTLQDEDPDDDVELID